MPHDSFAFSTRLRPGLGHAYEQFHRAIPSEVAETLKAAGVIEWRIYRNKTTLTHEVVATDRKRMDAFLDSDPVNERWQRQVAPYLSTEPAPELTAADRGTLIWDFSWPTR
ncbi:MAG TPA: L-rhamnose mutarotase [Diaminobutyricibacter sp.]